MNEIWKDIPGFENLYQVSNYGRVKSLYKPFNRNQFMYDRIMRIKPNKLGYSTLHFRCNGKEYRKLLHILVAELFIRNPHNKPFVLHKKALSDGGTNRVDNLYWGTQQDNMNDRYQENKYIVVERVRKIASEFHSKPINQYELDGTFIKTWKSAIEAGKQLDIDSSAIRKCCKGLKKSCGGYQWKSYNGSTDNIQPHYTLQKGV